jgi:hypothetical protein
MAKQKKRTVFSGLNIRCRTSVTSLGGEARRVPITLPKISILETAKDDDGKRSVTERSSV